jgi:hypothetical protein
VRLLDTLAVCYRGRRITSEGSESHRPRGAMTGAEESRHPSTLPILCFCAKSGPYVDASLLA